MIIFLNLSINLAMVMAIRVCRGKVRMNARTDLSGNNNADIMRMTGKTIRYSVSVQNHRIKN
ncbi:MAG TPA: hypothetical protein GXX26_09270 [Clostridiaceae bacterium]|nr:hypothetical protein [Clostridiaceae bacterium]